MTSLAQKIYHGVNPGDLPAYEVTEASRYLQVPYHTLYSWLRPVGFESGEKFCRKPLIERPLTSRKLSFLNLIEGHVIKALSKQHRVPLPEIRRAIEYAESKAGIERLLVHKDLKVGVKQLFVEQFGNLISLGRGGQLAMQKILDRYLERIEYNHKLPVKFYPFVQGSDQKVISISPTVSFGKPVVRGINTRTIAERFDLEEERAEIARDYGLTELEVEEAIIYESAA